MKTTATVIFGLSGMLALTACVNAIVRGAAKERIPAPEADAVLALAHKVADWQLANPSAHPPTDWTQGAGYAGMMAVARLPGGRKYEDAMAQMGESNRWTCGPRMYFADDYCVGQTYAELYLARRDPAMIAPLRAQFDAIMAKPANDRRLLPGKRNSPDCFSWCDSMFMGPPAWMRLWTATGNRKYLEWMDREWWKASDFLYDREEHLYFRDGTFFDRREANGKKVFWSRGNGWVLAGLARVLEPMPRDWPSRGEFETQFKEMAAKIAAFQPPDGLWRASLLDPDSYPLKETSGSGFFCFGLAWGINNGLLDRSEYEPAVFKAWAALVACVNPDGKLTHVQPIGADPKAFDPEATEVYGVGAFLLAASEVYKLVK